MGLKPIGILFQNKTLKICRRWTSGKKLN
jgi:hypothetical protein